MTPRAVNRIVLLLLAVAAAVFLPKLFLGDSAIYQTFLTDYVTNCIASPTKAAALAIAAAYAWRCARLLGAGNPGARPWWLMGSGLALWTVGQLSLATYQIILNIPTPFPSLADPAFMLGTLFLVVACFAFIRVYQQSGLAMGSGRDVLLTLVVAGVVSAIVGILVLRPIAAAATRPVELFLNLSYPTLDLLILLPLLALTRLTLKMRGGDLWLVWVRLLAGIAFVAVADVLYALFSTLHIAALDPLLDLGFAYSYIFLAWGVVTNERLVTANSDVS